MAIQKSKTLPSGATGNYWKIVLVTCDKVKLVATFDISLFTDKAHADSSGASLGLTKRFTFQCTKQELAGDLTALGYTKIKVKSATMFPPVNDLNNIHAEQHQYDADLADGTDV